MNKQLLFFIAGVVFATTVALYLYFKSKSIQPSIKPVDTSKYEKTIDSLVGVKNAAERKIDSLKFNIELLRVTKRDNHTRLKNDIEKISVYTDRKRLIDSLFSARHN